MPLRAWSAPCFAAMLLAAVPASAEGGKGADPLEEAKRHMRAGAAFYKDPSGHKCEEALREFRKAYELSGSLNALKGMAICALELERDGESIQYYSTYLAGKDASLDGKGAQLEPAERARVESDLATLRAAVATVTLSANAERVRVIDMRTPAQGYPIRNAYTLPARLGIHPGQHVLTATAEGRPDQVWKVEIANGGTYTHTFTFPSVAMGNPVGVPQTPPVATESPVEIRPVPAYVWATAGLTVALAVPWAVLAVRARDKNSEYEAANGKEPASVLTDMRNDVKNANLLADVFLGATLASLTATVVAYFARPTVRRKAGVRSLTVAFAPMGGGVSSGGALAYGWF